MCNLFVDLFQFSVFMLQDSVRLFFECMKISYECLIGNRDFEIQNG